MEDLLAGILFLGTTVYFFKRGVLSLLVWIVIGYLISYNLLNIKSRILALLIGLACAYLVCYLSTREHFEEEEKKEPDATSSKPHVDLGTTILHAYRNLSPEQIGGMRRDTKELMELQKELMGTLAEMKPAIEQGAELLGTFSQFFGKQE